MDITTPKNVIFLLQNAPANATSAAMPVPKGRRTFFGRITGTGAVSCTLAWYGTHDSTASGGELLDTQTLSGTTTDQKGDDIPAEWPYVYVILTSISGTGAAVNASVSY